MDPDESGLVDLHLPPEEGINQLGDSDKVSNIRGFQYLTAFMLDVIRAPEGGMQ